VRCCGVILLGALLAVPVAVAQGQDASGAPAPANRAVYLDKEGVIRWNDDRSEVALFGANYVLPTASDYRAAGYVHGDRQILHVTLMEDDGTSWSAAVPVDSTWSEPAIPLARFAIGRGVLLPQGFPGQWNYWVAPAEGRGGKADRPRLDHLERLQLSLRGDDGVVIRPDRYGVEVEGVTLEFGTGRAVAR
jgi:hypothetical protein